jgi:hypothetical protein
LVKNNWGKIAIKFSHQMTAVVAVKNKPFAPENTALLAVLNNIHG